GAEHAMTEKQNRPGFSELADHLRTRLLGCLWIDAPACKVDTGQTISLKRAIIVQFFEIEPAAWGGGPERGRKSGCRSGSVDEHGGVHFRIAANVIDHGASEEDTLRVQAEFNGGAEVEAQQTLLKGFQLWLGPLIDALSDRLEGEPQLSHAHQVRDHDSFVAVGISQIKDQVDSAGRAIE